VSEPILEARALVKQFRAGRGSGGSVVKAVSEVTLAIEPGSVTAIVGESGSGKSTLARVFAQLYPPTDGEVRFRGEVVHARSARTLREYTKHVQLIFQDPYGSLNPYRSIGHTVLRTVRVHTASSLVRTRAGGRAEVERVLERVGLVPGRDFYSKYPHELSGGQRQRVSIARALAVDPEVLIADEPISMLDVSLRLGVLDLLRALNKAGMTIIYVTHDLPSARWFAQTIAVMYAGRIVEEGPAEAVVNNPAHPYTKLLLAATPDPTRQRGEKLQARGEPPSLIHLPDGCPFNPRCPYADDRCRSVAPPSFAVGDGHSADCWLHDPSQPSAAQSGEG
jgi:peptide/nickel transport system ATP-binding protein